MVDYIYKYGLDIAQLYKGQPYFGVFWTNTLTHNAVRDFLSMEDRLLETLQETKARGILDDAIVIVMSDHGFRFPPSSNLPSGWYDIRLPMMYISLPLWFKEQYPDAARAMTVNQGRLISPYDLHLTLKDTMRRSGRVPAGVDTAGPCPMCQSLFKVVPTNRTCAQGAITERWCTCEKLQTAISEELKQNAATFVVAEINQIVHRLLNGIKADSSLCRELRLTKINWVSTTGLNTYLVNFYTNPGVANFEALVRHRVEENIFELIGSITRLSMYKMHSFCVESVELKTFCECSKMHNERN